jgi:putative Mn2+ efflux pump MntP
MLEGVIKGWSLRSTVQMKSGTKTGAVAFKTALFTAIVFCVVVLLFAAIGVLLGPPSARIGSARPEATILPHLAELFAFGLLLGAGSDIIYGRRCLPLVFLAPVLIVLLDLDHLPAYLGTAQTIRPAHSFVFIIVILAITAITIKRLDIDLVVLSATLAHLGIDTGLFAPFSPVSFWYAQLDPYRIPFLSGAVLATVAAGVVTRRKETPRG